MQTNIRLILASSTRWLCIPFLAVTLSGCASSDTPGIAALEKRYVVTYYDRNRDGIVDFELHDIPGAADAAWALSDTKFRGYYDVRLKFGYAFNRERVNLPVPERVKIASGNLRMAGSFISLRS